MYVLKKRLGLRMNGWRRIKSLQWKNLRGVSRKRADAVRELEDGQKQARILEFELRELFIPRFKCRSNRKP